MSESERPSSTLLISAPRPTAAARAQTTIGHGAVGPTHDQQMVQVLNGAAEIVMQEAQAHVVAAPPHEPPGPQLQALAKQQHVLTVTAQAIDQEASGLRPDVASPSSNVLVMAAEQLVMQAARAVQADHAVAAAMSLQIPSSQVTMDEVSAATQTAVAQAVEITGPLSSEVDVMMTASSLLQQHTRPLVEAAAAAPLPSSLSPPFPLVPTSGQNSSVFPSGSSLGIPDFLPSS